MDDPRSRSIPPDVGRIAGPLLIGYMLNWGLYGVLSVQMYLYHLAFTTDSLPFQILLYSVYALQSAQTFLLSDSAFTTFASGFGRMDLVDDIQHTWLAIPVMTAAIIFVVQNFYARQIYKMSNSKFIPFVIVSLSTIQLAGGIASGVLQHDALVFPRFSERNISIATGVWNGAAVLCDLILSVSMAHNLMANRTWKTVRTQTPLSIRLLVQSGAAVSVLAILNLILTFLPGRPPPTYYQTTSSILACAYANTLLACLNARVRISHASSTEESYYLDSSSSYRHTGPQLTIRSALVFSQEPAGPEVTRFEEDDGQGRASTSHR